MSDGRCAICGGAESQHGPDTIHKFTLKPGDLKSTRATESATPQNVIMLPTPNNPTMLDRLVEVMLKKEMMTRDEALYVLAGLPIPQPADPPLGNLTTSAPEFADPGRMFARPEAQ